MRASLLSVGCSCLALLLVAVGQASAQKAPPKPIAVTAVELTQAYGDTTEGNKKYYEKTLVVEGKVTANTRLVGPVLILEGFKGPKEREARRVICAMKPDFKAADVKVGDTVKVQGLCKGNGISRTITVDLSRCEVVK